MQVPVTCIVLNFRRPGAGEGEQRVKEGWWGQVWNCTSLPESFRKNKQTNKKLCASIELYCFIVTVTFFPLNKSLWTSKEKISYYHYNVSLWKTVVGGLQSKPGGIQPWARSSRNMGRFPQGWTGSNALRTSVSEVRCEGDCSYFLRMDRKPLPTEMTMERFQVGSPMGFSYCLSQQKRNLIVPELFTNNFCR